MNGETDPLKKTILKKKSLRVVAYLGLDRPNRCIDYGELLLKKLIASHHTIAGLVIHPSDRLADLARKYSIPYISIPQELLQPADKIKKALAENQQFIEFYKIWLGHIRSFGADIGITMWALWIPAEIFSMPPMGFINYHPAPLPQMRGMEPDTFAILEGRKEIFGAVHKVNHAFDCGEIVSWTRHIKIHRYDTPVSVLENLNREGISTIIHVLNSFADGTAKGVPQYTGEGTRTTRDMARKASFIDWRSDTVEIIDRKLRAFCGQDIGIRLKAEYQGTIHNIVDLEGYHGNFSGKPGDVLGLYCGKGFFKDQPVIRVLDGIIIAHLGKVITPLSYSSIFYNECPQEKLILPGRRKRITNHKMVIRSITGLNQKN